MAKRRKAFLDASGAVGPVVFYEYRGIPCMRSKPDGIKQSKKSKASAQLFGLASNIRACLTSMLGIFITMEKEQKTQYRLLSRCREFLKTGLPPEGEFATEIPSMMGFEFVETSPLLSRMRVRPELTWSATDKLVIKMPAMNPVKDIDAPQFTSKVFAQIVVAGCHYDRLNGATSFSDVDFEIPYTNNVIEEKTFEIPFITNPVQLTVVALSFQFGIPKNNAIVVENDPLWTPAAIIGAAARGKEIAVPAREDQK